MVNLLSNMIDTIKSTVDAAHTVNEKSHIVRCPVHPQIRENAEPPVGAPFRNVTVIDGYYHEERGQILAFFDAQQGANPCEQPSGYEGEALAAAQQARAQGVTDELAFIGIPYFEQILQSWRNLIAVDMSAYKRPMASGTIVDKSDITVTFPDDHTYTAKLQLPNVILWSNHSAWTKV